MAEEIFDEVGACKYAYSDIANGLYEKRLEKGDRQMIILQNAFEDDKQVEINEEIISSTADVQGKTVTLKAKSTAIIIVNR